MSQTDEKQKRKPIRKRVSTPFAANLRKVIDERKLSLRNAAALAGVNVSVISGWLDGQMPHDLLAVHRLASTLSVSFEWLVTGHNENIVTQPKIEDLFDAEEVFDGLLHITAKRLKRKVQK